MTSSPKTFVNISINLSASFISQGLGSFPFSWTNVSSATKQKWICLFLPILVKSKNCRFSSRGSFYFEFSYTCFMLWNFNITGVFIFLARPFLMYGSYMVVSPISNDFELMTLTLWRVPFIDLVLSYLCAIPSTFLRWITSPSSNGCFVPSRRVTKPFGAELMLFIITSTGYYPFLSNTSNLSPKSLNTLQ